MRMKLVVPVAALCAGLLSSASHAVQMYRWVDDQGTVNISDTVPDKYRKSAQKIDSRQFELSEVQRRDAAARAALARSAAAAPKVAPAAQATGPAGAGSGPSTLGSARSSASTPAQSDANDCATLNRQYLEALACFMPYVQANGSVKAEGYARCPVVQDPSPRCGVPTLK